MARIKKWREYFAVPRLLAERDYRVAVGVGKWRTALIDRHATPAERQRAKLANWLKLATHSRDVASSLNKPSPVYSRSANNSRTMFANDVRTEC